MDVIKKNMKKYGQYFTTDVGLLDKVKEFVINKNPKDILEPSFGQGDLVCCMKTIYTDCNYDCYEIDETIESLFESSEKTKIIYKDFLQQKIDKKYDIIIGNPPYVKKKTGNLYIEFIEKCWKLLEDDGEMIMIVPSDFLKLTRTSKLIKNMVIDGSFTDFYFPNKENLFKNASIDVVIFRYQLGYMTNVSSVNGVRKNTMIKDGIITFSSGENQIDVELLKSTFDVFVGMVSGKEEVFKNNIGNMTILNDQDTHDTHIYINTFPSNNKDINNHLLKFKDNLIERRIKKFTTDNWYQWGAPRNMKYMKQHMGEDCIYVRNITRKPLVAFIGKVEFFGGRLLCLVPKKKITEIRMKSIKNHLNSTEFKQNYMYSERFKIGHRQLENCSIPT